MHVGLLSPAWSPRSYSSGVVTYVHWLREGLRRRGHRVSIFPNLLDGPEDQVHPVRQSPMFRARSWLASKRGNADYLVRNWGAACAGSILDVHRRDRIDVIEMEESFGWAADVARCTSIPTVVKLHGPAFLTAGDPAPGPARSRIEWEGAALHGLPVLTAPARFTLERTLSHYRLAPAIARHVVNPLTLPDATPLWDLDRCDRQTLLFVGRFDRLKGADVVLKAFANLLRRNPDLRLVFVGPDIGMDWESRPWVHFEELAGLLLDANARQRVEFKGKLSPPEIYALHTHAFVTLIASRFENQSYTALEAMLQGCPVVSSDGGGQAEIVSHGVTGLLAKAGSADDLGEKIQALLDNPEHAAVLGRNARAQVLERHDPDRVAAQTIEVYEGAVELAGRAAR